MNDMRIYHSYILWCVCSNFCSFKKHFFFYWLGRVLCVCWIQSFDRSIYLSIYHLSIFIYLSNIFSHSVTCLFVYLMVYFEQKVLMLIKFNLSILCFMECAFLCLSKEYLPIPSFQRFFSFVHCFRSFMFLPLSLWPILG